MEKIRIDIVPGGVTPVAHASQNDVGRSIRFNLFSGDSEYTLTGSEAINISMRRPDGTLRTQGLTNTMSNYVVFTTVDGDLTVAGVYSCELTIYKGDAIRGSRNFVLKVEPDAYDGANVVVMDCGPADICTFETNLADNLVSLIANITANQDLHGYDHPWPAGGGKNKLEVTSSSGTSQGITATVNSDGSITVNGTATGTYIYTVNDTLTLDGNYILSGCPAGGSAGTYRMDCYWSGQGALIDSGNGVAISPNGNAVTTRIVVMQGVTVNNLVFWPMIRLATETDATFAPYENICPIVGHSELNLVRCGVNLWNGDAHDGKGMGGTGTEYTDAASFATLFVPLAVNTTIYLNPTNWRNWINWYKADQTFLSQSVVDANNETTVPVGAAYARFTGILSEKATAMVCFASQKTEPYHAYNGETFTVQFGQTVYGGVYDAIRGKVTLTHELTTPSAAQVVTVNNLTCVRGVCASIKEAGHQSDIISSHFGLVGADSDVADGTMINQFWQYYNLVFCSPSNFQTVAEFETWVSNNDVKICVPLATPIEIDVSELAVDTIVGVNNVFGDTGETELKYLKIEG